jgi:hypothetical protein
MIRENEKKKDEILLKMEKEVEYVKTHKKGGYWDFGEQEG